MYRCQVHDKIIPWIYKQSETNISFSESTHKDLHGQISIFVQSSSIVQVPTYLQNSIFVMQHLISCLFPMNTHHKWSRELLKRYKNNNKHIIYHKSFNYVAISKQLKQVFVKIIVDDFVVDKFWNNSFFFNHVLTNIAVMI